MNWRTLNADPRMRSGTLYLMPVWLGEHGGPEMLPPQNLSIAKGIRTWFTEHEKTARQMLRRMLPNVDLGAQRMMRLDKDSTAAEVDAMVRVLAAGEDGAILSEAGMPGIADPGALLVAAAHRAGIPVVPLVGPSSLLLALAASGLNGQQFTFHGYLPRTPQERRAAIRRLEAEAERTQGAQLFIETPYRNDALVEDLLRTCAPDTLLTLAVDLTQPDGQVRTCAVREWQKAPWMPGKRPAVFILGRPAAVRRRVPPPRG